MKRQLFLLLLSVVTTAWGTGVRAEAPNPAGAASALDTVIHAGGRRLLERQAAAEQLGSHLDDEAFDTLIAFLGRPAGEDALPPDELNALKNKVINVLKNQRRDVNPLIGHLIALYEPSGQDEVLRDYCIQHLGTMYAAASPAHREPLRLLFWVSLDRKQGSIAGTGLIALAHNIGPDIPTRDVADKALAISGDSSYGDAARITAFQIAARLDKERILPLARDVAFGRGSIPLRVSAIAAVGAAGDAGDLPRLRPLAESTDIRLRKSAETAIRRIKQRAGTSEAAR